MAYQLKSNPLDNNPLFAGSGEPEQSGQAAEQDAKPKKQTRGKSGKQAKQPKKETAKAQSTRGESTEKKAAEQTAKAAAGAEADKDAYTRATFIVRRDLLEQLKDYAFTERREIKEVINEILAAALEEIAANYQKDGRTILSRPE